LRNARHGYRAGNGLLLDPNTESQPCSQPQEKYGTLTLGLTAEKLEEQYSISREEQDEFAHRSQVLADQAIKEGRHKKEIVPYEIKKRKKAITFHPDQHPSLPSPEMRPTLPAVYKENGTVTSGKESGTNDEASVVRMMNKEKVEEYGLKPKAKIISYATSGVGPEVMGIGPVDSTNKALKMAGLSMEDIGIIE